MGGFHDPAGLSAPRVPSKRGTSDQHDGSRNEMGVLPLRPPGFKTLFGRGRCKPRRWATRGNNGPWCIATCNVEASAPQIINLCDRRWIIEPGFRDTKDLCFGMGTGVLRMPKPQRRDRPLLFNAFAIVLVGAAGESLDMDRRLKVNTLNHRTHSLFLQGRILYNPMSNVPKIRACLLIDLFSNHILNFLY